jgi:hypothetical protein
MWFALEQHLPPEWGVGVGVGVANNENHLEQWF